MRVAVTGASGVFGRGIAARLRSQGHEVVGLARHRPQNWLPGSDFVAADIRDAEQVYRAVHGVDAVAHCAWVVNSNPDEKLTREINIGGTENVLAAMDRAGTRRIVFASSVLAFGARPRGSAKLGEDDELRPSPDHFYAFHKAQVESLLATSGKEWVAIRPAIVVGRDVDNTIMRLLGSPAFPDVEGSADRPLQVVHTDDVHRLFVRAVLGNEVGAVNLAAAGEPSVRVITAKLNRRVFPARKKMLDGVLGALNRRGLVEASPAEFELLLNFPIMDTSRLRDEWGYHPAFDADECLSDFERALRGKIGLGRAVLTVPWRMPFVHSVPEPSAPPPDGAPLHPAGPRGLVGEFDTPVDDRFPTFVASNLSEALPGPFSPASASSTVRGLRAGGSSIAERLRLPGVIGAEVAARSIGVFGHRVYGGVTSVYYMAESMLGANPASLIEQFFGRELGDTPVFGEQRPHREKTVAARRIWDAIAVGVTGAGLVAASTVDAKAFVGDVDQLEAMLPTELADLDDSRLQSLILLARDLVVHGWNLSAWAALMCTATATAAERLGGELPTAGDDLASARGLAGIRRLTALARSDPGAVAALGGDGALLPVVREKAPSLFAAIVEELDRVGHRGPGECELRSTTYGDDPEQFARMIAKSLAHGGPESPGTLGRAEHPRGRIPGRLAARQLKDREVRRDRVVRATWVLRRLTGAPSSCR